MNRLTQKGYTYQDKLAYIDVCRKHLHRAENASDCVLELMKEYLECEVSEYGDIPTRDSMLLNFEQYIHLQPTPPS